MRYWEPISDPDKQRTRSRSLQVNQSAGSGIQKRPLFSRPDEETESEKGMVSGEARLDDVTPVDNSISSKNKAVVRKPTLDPAIKVSVSTDNVSAPPTDAEITAAFGPRKTGFIGIIIDGGGVGTVWLVVKSKSSTWWYEQLTKAV